MIKAAITRLIKKFDMRIVLKDECDHIYKLYILKNYRYWKCIYCNSIGIIETYVKMEDSK